MPLVFNMFMASVFLSGVTSIYMHFSSGSSPTSLYSWINAQSLMGTFLLLVGAGLYFRVGIARTAGIAVAIWSLILTALLPILAFVGFFAASFIGALFLGKMPALASLPGLMGTVFVVSVVLVYFFYKSLQVLRSPEVEIEFPEDLWFGMDLKIGRINGRVVIFLTALLAIVFVDRWSVHLMPRQMVQAKETQEVKEAIKAFSELPEVKIANERAQRERAEKAEAGRIVKRCQFSFDEKKLLLLGSDGSIHRVDLSNGQVQKTMLNEQRPERADILTNYTHEQRIAPDLEHYFDGNTTIRSFTDPQSKYYISSSEYRFITFTTAPNQLVVINKKENKFQLLEMPTGKVIWSSSAVDPKVSKTGSVDAYVNHEMGWMLLRTEGGNHHVLNMRDGSFMPIEIPFRYVKKAWSEPSGKLWFFTGPTEGLHEKVKTYSLELPQKAWTEQNAYGDLKIFDPMSGIGLVADYTGALVHKDTAPRNVFKSQVLGAALMNSPQWILAAEEGQSQASLLNTTSAEIRPVGDIFSDKMTQARVCTAGSRRRYMWMLAFGPRFEVFWSGQLVQPNIQPLIRNLDIQPVL